VATAPVPAPGDPASPATAGELGAARSWLFVPGDRPERFAKAAASGADVVICDLEDSVAPAAKDAARAAVAAWLRAGGSAAVRVNPAGSPWHDADIAALRAASADIAASAGPGAWGPRTGGLRAGGLRAVMLPKAQDPAAVSDVAAAIGAVPIVALVETALGILRAADIAALPPVARLAFGSLDYALDIGADADHEPAMLLARASLVMCSRAVGGPAPLDGGTVALDDEARLLADAAAARALGFTGKLCVHPRQIPAVHRGFAPAPEQLARAREILAVARATPLGAARTADGMLIDAPVVARAAAILAAAADPESPGASHQPDTIEIAGD
jgi:citrate lyase subunit beta/citryl-CoA lyase